MTVLLSWLSAGLCPSAGYCAPACLETEAALRESSRHKLAIAPAAFRKLPDAARWLIVDVRSEAAYEEFRIPSSIRMAAGQLRHSALLNGRKLLLVTEGYRDAFIEREASKILGAADVRILDGGLHAWWSEKLPLDGKLVRAVELNRVSAPDFLADAQSGGWKVVWVSFAKSDKLPALPVPVDATLSTKPAEFRDSLNEWLRKSRPAVGTLLVTDSKASEQTILSAVKERLPGKVFLLSGGPSALSTQPSELTATLVKKSSEPCKK